MNKSKLKKRLRKKSHLGEFQEFGFEVSVNLKEGVNDVQSNKFWCGFIGEIESHGLICGGGGDCKSLRVFVTSEKKFDSPTVEKKEKIQKWLENYSEVENFKIGDFKDAWNSQSYIT